ncbi:hypothetical protein V500_10936 [Pseudogymnoascus sp. VKM F-4518 (FW-2643)]|nr:hypothetical protein V500_10936 [Pseudogymnoascus sp. VKM F-4518 (FW-2643)]
MASSRQNGGALVSALIGSLRSAIGFVPPLPSSPHYGQQAMASPSDTITHESSSPRADPEPVSITTLWPHAPDLPPGSSLILEDRLLRALCNARVDNIYGPVGAGMIQPSTHNNPSNQSVVDITGHGSLAPPPPTADQQALPSQSDDKRDRAITKFRENHQRAITFDDDDDEQYYHNPLLVQQCSALAPIFAPIRTPSPAFQSMNMFLVFNDGEQASGPNLSVSKQLNPAAPAFEYQPSHDNIQDTAPKPDQQALQPQDPISEPPSPEFPAETARAPSPEFQTMQMLLVLNDGEQASDPDPSVSKQLNPTAPAFEYQPRHDNIQDTAPGADQQALQPQDPTSEPPSPGFPAEAARAPAPQPHAPRQGPVKQRELPHHPKNKKKQARAAFEAQRQNLANGGGAVNGNGAAHSQRSQNGSSAFKPSWGPYRSAQSNRSPVTTRPSGGPSGFGGSTGPSSPNGSFGPSTPPGTDNNSPRTPATTDTNLSTSPTPSLGPPHKVKDTAGSSNSVARPATPGPSREPRTPSARTGTPRRSAVVANPPHSPPAPTTGTAWVPKTATRRPGGLRGARTWHPSPSARTAKNWRSAG